MTFAEFWPEYVRAHSKPATRIVHLVGTLGGWMFLGAALVERQWGRIALALVVPYALAWAAHLGIERNRPVTLRHPVWSWWADQRMVFLMIVGRMGDEVRRYTTSS